MASIATVGAGWQSEQAATGQRCNLIGLWRTVVTAPAVTGELLWHLARTPLNKHHWSWIKYTGICPQCWIHKNQRTCQCDFVWSKLPVLTCHHNVPRYFISCRTQIQLNKPVSLTQALCFMRGQSCASDSVQLHVILHRWHETYLWLLKVYCSWRPSSSVLHSSIKSSVQPTHLHVFTHISKLCLHQLIGVSYQIRTQSHFLIAASSVWLPTDWSHSTTFILEH